jgi:hypothetical protein
MKHLDFSAHAQRRSIVEQYTYAWHRAILGKNKLCGGLFNEEATIEIPITYAPENTMKKFIPECIALYNDIVEDDKYFIFNNKHKERKNAFLKEILLRDHYNRIETENTKGRLMLTIDPVWFGRSSDRDGGWTSWSSCFSPTGCYRQSSLEMATSLSMFMAMILNNDGTKIIGRKWVVIPILEDLRYAPFIAFLKSYGTFPTHYQKSLSDFLISTIFGEEKKTWSVSSDTGNNTDRIKNVYTNRYMGGTSLKANWDYNFGTCSPERSATIYIDAPPFITSQKGFAENDVKMSVLFDGIDCWDDDDSDGGFQCEFCHENGFDEYDGAWVEGSAEHEWWCDECVNNHAVMDYFLDEYVPRNDPQTCQFRYHVCGTSVYYETLFTQNLDELESVVMLDDDGGVVDEILFFEPEDCHLIMCDEDGYSMFQSDWNNHSTTLKDAWEAKREAEEDE